MLPYLKKKYISQDRKEVAHRLAEKYAPPHMVKAATDDIIEFLEEECNEGD